MEYEDVEKARIAKHLDNALLYLKKLYDQNKLVIKQLEEIEHLDEMKQIEKSIHKISKEQNEIETFIEKITKELDVARSAISIRTTNQNLLWTEQKAKDLGKFERFTQDYLSKHGLLHKLSKDVDKNYVIIIEKSKVLARKLKTDNHYINVNFHRIYEHKDQIINAIYNEGKRVYHMNRVFNAVSRNTGVVFFDSCSVVEMYKDLRVDSNKYKVPLFKDSQRAILHIVKKAQKELRYRSEDGTLVPPAFTNFIVNRFKEQKHTFHEPGSDKELEKKIYDIWLKFGKPKKTNDPEERRKFREQADLRTLSIAARSKVPVLIVSDDDDFITCIKNMGLLKKAPVRIVNYRRFSRVA